MQKYNFLYAGEEFIQECEELKSVIVKGKQFFYNPQAQSPIYQSIKVVREEGAFVGDYCIQTSHIVYLQKVDPLFIIILILGESLLNETRAFDMDQLFDVNIFEDIQFAKCIKEHKGVVERLDLIFKVNQFNGENYYKYDIEKLFTFLDAKRMKLQEYLNTTEDFQDQVMSKDDQISMYQSYQIGFHNSEYYLISQYLTQQISQKYNESRKILKNLELKQSSDTKYQQQHERNKDTQQDKKKVNINKQPTKSEQQQQKDAKTSGKISSFFQQKQENK